MPHVSREPRPSEPVSRPGAGPKLPTPSRGGPARPRPPAAPAKASAPPLLRSGIQSEADWIRDNGY